MPTLIEFLKEHSNFKDKDNFIDQFIKIREGGEIPICENYPIPKKFKVNIETAVKWLKVTMRGLKSTLEKSTSYDPGIDYIIFLCANGQKRRGRGGHNRKMLLMTTDCFKNLCLSSNTPMGKLIRGYYIKLEELVDTYREAIIRAQSSEITTLLNNQKKVDCPVGGLVYIMFFDGGYKIGKTNDLSRRLPVYRNARKDSPPVVFWFETDDIHTLEKMAKLLLKNFEYINTKEFYMVNEEDVVLAIKMSAAFIKSFRKKSKLVPKQCGGGFLTGNFYITHDIVSQSEIRDFIESYNNRCREAIVQRGGIPVDDTKNHRDINDTRDTSIITEIDFEIGHLDQVMIYDIVVDNSEVRDDKGWTSDDYLYEELFNQIDSMDENSDSDTESDIDSDTDTEDVPYDSSYDSETSDEDFQ